MGPSGALVGSMFGGRAAAGGAAGAAATSWAGPSDIGRRRRSAYFFIRRNNHARSVGKATFRIGPITQGLMRFRMSRQSMVKFSQSRGSKAFMCLPTSIADISALGLNEDEIRRRPRFMHPHIRQINSGWDLVRK